MYKCHYKRPLSPDDESTSTPASPEVFSASTPPDSPHTTRPQQSDVFDQLDDLPSPSATQDNDGNYTPETGDERDKNVERVGFDLPTPGVFFANS